MGGDDGGGSGGGGGCVGVVDCEGVCKGGGLWSVVYGCDEVGMLQAVVI